MFTGCEKGFHGPKCNLPCGDGCGEDGSCDQTNATCIFPRCLDGYQQTPKCNKGIQ